MSLFKQKRARANKAYWGWYKSTNTLLDVAKDGYTLRIATGDNSLTVTGGK